MTQLHKNVHSNLKLLVVDDAELPREVLCEQLRLLGHVAVIAENGEQAVARYIETAPDVVLMDWMMPVMDGIAATRAIRALPGARWVPIIMLSAYGDESEIVNALKNGCDDYLINPIKLPVLEAKIQALQRIAEMHNEIERSQRELQLGAGQIHIALRSTVTVEGTVVSIHIRDSGKGFVLPAAVADDLSGNQTPAGRGIALVRKFCRTLEYRGCGNEVYAELLC